MSSPAGPEEALAGKATRTPRALILHGFTGNLESVRLLGSTCEGLALPYVMPLLRGHGTRPEDLLGVTWHDWYADGERALLDLTRDGSRAVIIGLSMGGLVTLDLAGRHPDRVCGVVTIAAALEMWSPLLSLVPLMSRFKVWWQGKPEMARDVPASYPRFPLKTLMSLIEYKEIVRQRLDRVTAPILVTQSWADQTVRPRGARVIYDRVRSLDKELGRFDHARHDMLLGVESEAVAARIAHWLRVRLPAWSSLA